MAHFGVPPLPTPSSTSSAKVDLTISDDSSTDPSSDSSSESEDSSSDEALPSKKGTDNKIYSVQPGKTSASNQHEGSGTLKRKSPFPASEMSGAIPACSKDSLSKLRDSLKRDLDRVDSRVHGLGNRVSRLTTEVKRQTKRLRWTKKPNRLSRFTQEAITDRVFQQLPKEALVMTGTLDRAVKEIICRIDQIEDRLEAQVQSSQDALEARIDAALEEQSEKTAVMFENTLRRAREQFRKDLVVAIAAMREPEDAHAFAPL